MLTPLFSRTQPGHQKLPAMLDEGWAAHLAQLSPSPDSFPRAMWGTSAAGWMSGFIRGTAEQKCVLLAIQPAVQEVEKNKRCTKSCEAQQKTQARHILRAGQCFSTTFVIFPHWAVTYELPALSKRASKSNFDPSHSCPGHASVTAAPQSRCCRQAVLYFSPNVTQQAARTGYSLTSLGQEQLLL